MAETSMAGQTVALAAVLAAGTFLLYFLKHVLEAVRAWHDDQRRAERLICALYAEIEANVQDFQGFLDDSTLWARTAPDSSEAGGGRPGGIGHDLVYQTHLAELASLPRAVIHKVVSFYALQQRLAATLETLACADSEQRSAAVKHARRIAQEGVTFGKEVLYRLEMNAPLGLVNSALQSPAELRPEPA
ncbi:MAG: hypothetical protein ACLFPA_01635 [Dichotomicrobium sp.]